MNLTVVEDGIGAAVPIAFASVATQRIVEGDTRCGTLVSGSCSEAGCDATVSVVPSPACPLPIAPDATGSIAVTLSTDGPDPLATFDFTGVEVPGGALRVDSVVTTGYAVPDQENGTLVVVYIAELVELRHDGVYVEEGGESLWTVVVTPSEDPEVPIDRYLIEGTSSFIRQGEDDGESSTEAEAVAVYETLVGPDCALNPVEGSADVSRYAWNDAGTAATYDNERLISGDAAVFHASCDGRVDVDGEALPIDLLAAD